MPTPLKNSESRTTKNATVAIGRVSEPHTAMMYLVATNSNSAWKSPDEASPKLSLSERAKSCGRNFGEKRMPQLPLQRSRGSSIAIPHR